MSLDDIEERMGELEQKVSVINSTLLAMNASLQRIETMLNTTNVGVASPISEEELKEFKINQLKSMSAKQVAVSLLVMAQKSNDDITRLLNITLNNTKTHVRLSIRRLNVSDRTELRERMLEFIGITGEAGFERITNFPADWGKTFEGDPDDPAYQSCGFKTAD